MPQRINGIGTAYVGKSNVQTRPGECESCRRGVVLTSYDTRLWFTFLFIPVIPLGKKRILDYCPSCTTHRAVGATEWAGIKTQAMEDAARKALAEPANAEAQVELHRTCLIMGEWDKADAFQKKLEEEFARDAKTQLYLAGAHAYRGRAAEAEAALARARAIDPAIAPPEPPEAPARPPKKGGVRRQAVVLGAIVGLIIAGMAVASVLKAGSRSLYLVSGYDEALTVEVAGRPSVSVRGGGKLPFEIPEGRHRARVTGAVSEDIDVVLESNFFTRLFDDRVFVLNPGGAALVVVEQTGYSKNPVPASALEPYRLFYGKSFFSVRDIDYTFEAFPSQITTDESGVVKKRRVDLLGGSVQRFVFGLINESRHDDALNLAEWGIRTRPAEREVLLPVYVSLARNHGKADRALAFLRERAAARPVEVDVHRQYQRMREEAPELRAEYDAALEKTPNDADLLYLRGRLERNVAVARAWHEKALRANPKQGYAHYALGYGHAAAGDWAAAKAALEKAVESRPDSVEFKQALRRAKMGVGELEAVEKEIRDEVKKAPVMLGPSRELARVLVARGKTAEAKALVEPYRELLRRQKEANAADLVRTLEADVLYAAADFEGLLNLKPTQPKEVPEERLVALMELGKAEEALNLLKTPQLLFLLAALLARPDDAGIRERAAAALEQADGDGAPLAKALRSGEEADLAAAMEVALEPTVKAAVLAALARRIPARSTELRAKAAILNKQLYFPYHAIKRACEGK
jgi:tetratricopeptide (TPR) repeat protein